MTTVKVGDVVDYWKSGKSVRATVVRTHKDKTSILLKVNGYVQHVTQHRPEVDGPLESLPAWWARWTPVVEAVVEPKVEVKAKKKVTVVTNNPLTREQLIAKAKKIAVKCAAKNGKVSSTDIWAVFQQTKVNTGGNDPRWMGAVFDKKTWVKTGYEFSGSHGRPVAIWELRA